MPGQLALLVDLIAVPHRRGVAVDEVEVEPPETQDLGLPPSAVNRESDQRTLLRVPASVEGRCDLFKLERVLAASATTWFLVVEEVRGRVRRDQLLLRRQLQRTTDRLEHPTLRP